MIGYFVYSYYIMSALNLNPKNNKIVSYVVAFESFEWIGSYFKRKRETCV